VPTDIAAGLPLVKCGFVTPNVRFYDILRSATLIPAPNSAM
jgi:hypothetical protein